MLLIGEVRYFSSARGMSAALGDVVLLGLGEVGVVDG